MLKVALTGGIGSGKSTAAEFFHQLGVPIIDADMIARDLTLPPSSSIDIIVSHFGTKILNKNGELDRTLLREIIFKDNSEKKWLESLLHPLIVNEMKKQIHNIRYPYCILVIPLLIEESNQIDFVDRILVIDCPVELQIERAKHRDQSAQQSIESIILSQSQRNERLAAADDVILNDSDLNSLKHKVNELHLFYKKLAKKKELNDE